MDPRPIGVFDSGLGGLTVLSELVRTLPDERFLYFGDTARVPYGPRSPRIIERYSREVAAYLAGKDIKMLVIACNTATAHAEALLAKELPFPVIGVIAPGVEALLDRTSNRRVGVVGTRSTIKSGAYESAILARDPTRRVHSKACPLFVPLVEEGWIDRRVTSLVVQEYLSELVREEIDTVILGCTHYPVLKGIIHEEFPNLNLVDSSVEIARATAARLAQLAITAEPGSGSVQILVTDITDQLRSMEKLFGNFAFQSVEEVRL